ncbi:ATP-NAD kinase family protein [Halarchaeum nitratireducens]|uniref:N-acetylglucosamine-1-phosphate uridyltransferase n=1 Tax=Halarchaeum nitratireducens TaxID=489913 RepID=A0A830GCT6_9EURY|nr:MULTISPECIES: ATP-NAD kinase family protein [Halarchaeum]MBP2250871.1 NAD+ kinase [Halarchaeum solikamskense]GGN19533.1 N-acetylglucosamine-1-phosphate uridyltransferase [Halarchaeum nitratireducens]
MRTIGVVVNPIAGMGGRVGLKGTDDRVEEARERGAEPRAPERALAALRALADAADATDAGDGHGIALLAYGDAMGENAAREAGFAPTVVGRPAGAETTATDTRDAVRAFVERRVDLVLFVGGDGTATDVADAIDEAGSETPMLGVPAGVKVYSSVFARTPRDAGRIAATFERTERREVNDIDEDAYRAGEVRAELRAVATVPVAPALQSGKQRTSGSVDTLAAGFAADAEAGVTYLFGPGGTVGAIERALGIEGSPLGVDAWRDGELLVRDGSEAELLDALGERTVVVVSPIGGQGFVLGRGNQQLSPAIVRRSELAVVASPEKLAATGVLHVDTGDTALDADLRGWIEVRTGRHTRRLVKVE